MIPARWMQSLSIARSGLYFLESLPLALVNRLITHPDLPAPSDEQVRSLWKHILKLHDREARQLETGTYDWKALDLENPLRHLRSYVEVMGDGMKVAWRMRNKQTKALPNSVELEGLPDYYTRNFHFQTDGYFSEASARRYDHQVEILFSGTAGAMRRLILPILKQHANPSGHYLEIGCGAGSATKPVLQTFPRAKVTALDLSPPYLKVAQDHLRRFQKVDFVQGNGAELCFKSESFDAVFSVYVLHELPATERQRLLREAYRVLKPGGVMVIADSLQIDDEPELNWALERFPKIYHEPFYKNYAHNKIERMLEKVSGQSVEMDHAFFTKVVWVQKPGNSA